MPFTVAVLTEGDSIQKAHISHGYNQPWRGYEVVWHKEANVMSQFLIYSLFTYMAFTTAVDEPWFMDTSYFWRNYPNHPLT